MSDGPYDYAAERWDAEKHDPGYEDRPSRAEADADMPTPGQMAALTRAANERRAQMSPEQRARHDAAMADPWATTRQEVRGG